MAERQHQQVWFAERALCVMALQTHYSPGNAAAYCTCCWLIAPLRRSLNTKPTNNQPCTCCFKYVCTILTLHSSLPKTKQSAKGDMVPKYVLTPPSQHTGQHYCCSGQSVHKPTPSAPIEVSTAAAECKLQERHE